MNRTLFIFKTILNKILLFLNFLQKWQFISRQLVVNDFFPFSLYFVKTGVGAENFATSAKIISLKILCGNRDNPVAPDELLASSEAERFACEVETNASFVT